MAIAMSTLCQKRTFSLAREAVAGRQISIGQSAAMQSDCPAVFFVSAIGHNDRLVLVAGLGRGPPWQEATTILTLTLNYILLCAASIVILVFAWAVAAYSHRLVDRALSLWAALSM